MSSNLRRIVAVLACLLMTVACAQAQVDDDCPGKVYGKGRKAICLPLGEVSFADEAVTLQFGNSRAQGVHAEPEYALGEPDYVSPSKPGFVALGCDGVLSLRFTDNVLVDVEGPDLYVFEAGPFVEETELAISVDGQNWIDVGRIEGARAAVDIAGFVQPGERFAYVRLTNASKACGGRTPGADIDAVAAVGAEHRLSLDSAVLFEVGRSDLRPQAVDALAALIGQIRKLDATRITVEGHTDSDGDAAGNQQLSLQRAESVRRHLIEQGGLPAERVRSRGFGETRPIADNDTAEGKARNRRVDILVGR